MTSNHIESYFESIRQTNDYWVSDSITKEELKLFVKLYLDEIGVYYPFSTIDSANKYVNNHLGKHITGTSTISRKIWKIIDGDKILGFTLSTLKSNRTVKFGPTVILKRYQGRKIGQSLRLLVEKQYLKQGISNFYSTTRSANYAGISYVRSIGYNLTSILKDYFVDGEDELVFSKSYKEINATSITSWNRPIIQFEDYDYSVDKLLNSISKNKTLSSDINIENYCNFSQFDIIKSKSSSVICKLKKGNSLKIIPLNLQLQKYSILNLIDDISVKNKQYSKAYIEIPIAVELKEIFINCGFVIEGLRYTDAGLKILNLSKSI